VLANVNVPAFDNKSVHDVFCGVDEPPDLLKANLIFPPELKKCLAAFADAKVTVKIWLTLLVHALVLDEEVPACPVDIFPPDAFALLVVIAVISASKFDSGNILPPVDTEFDAFVTLVPW
jgi:hypothetical protein